MIGVRMRFTSEICKLHLQAFQIVQRILQITQIDKLRGTCTKRKDYGPTGETIQLTFQPIGKLIRPTNRVVHVLVIYTCDYALAN